MTTGDQQLRLVGGSPLPPVEAMRHETFFTPGSAPAHENFIQAGKLAGLAVLGALPTALAVVSARASSREGRPSQIMDPVSLMLSQGAAALGLAGAVSEARAGFAKRRAIKH